MLVDTNAIAQIFVRNLDNKITVDLANGMIGEILKLMPKLETVDDEHNTTADPAVTE